MGNTHGVVAATFKYMVGNQKMCKDAFSQCVLHSNFRSSSFVERQLNRHVWSTNGYMSCSASVFLANTNNRMAVK